MIDQSSSDIWGHPIPLMHSQLKPYLARLRQAHLTYLQTHRKDFSTHLETQRPRKCVTKSTHLRAQMQQAAPSENALLVRIKPISTVPRQLRHVATRCPAGGTGVVQHRVQVLHGSM